MRPELILIAFISISSALPSETNQNVDVAILKESFLTTDEASRNSAAERIILQLLERLRALMINGSDNFPVLDPIYIENIHVDEEILGIPNAFITIKNMTVRDMSTFETEHIELTLISLILQRYKFEFDLSIPAVNVNAESYDMWLKIFGGEIYGKGNMSLQVVKPRVKGHVVVGVRITNERISINIQECRINIGLDDFKIVIKGLFNNEASSEFVSEFLSNLIPEMLDFFEKEISIILSAMVLIVGNIILADIDLRDLIGSGTLNIY